MHSRIFQLSLYEQDVEDYIIPEDFVDDGFVGTIADYISADCDRKEDIEWLESILTGMDVIFNKEDGYVVFGEKFRTQYFKERFEKFKELASSITLDMFSTDDLALFRIKNVIEEKYGFYVYFDYPETFCSFVRTLKPGTKYYFGATIDYHS